MEHAAFDAIKGRLDKEIDEIELLGAAPIVGIRFGLTLYTEFRRRGLFADKLADFVLWKFKLPSYRDLFVSEGSDVPDNEYQIGSSSA